MSKPTKKTCLTVDTSAQPSTSFNLSASAPGIHDVYLYTTNE